MKPHVEKIFKSLSAFTLKFSNGLGFELVLNLFRPFLAKKISVLKDFLPMFYFSLTAILMITPMPSAEARMREMSDQELAKQVTPFMIVPQAVVDALQDSGKASDLEALEALKKLEDLFLKSYFRDDITAGGIETITSRVEHFDFQRNAWVVDVTTRTKVAHVLVTTEHGGSIEVTNIDVLTTTTFGRH